MHPADEFVMTALIEADEGSGGRHGYLDAPQSTRGSYRHKAVFLARN
jgi:hypothetical protein